MRRAAVSVTNNIAEGHARWYLDNMRFLRISRGSLGELIDDFYLCLDEQYGDQQLAQSLIGDAKELIRRVNGYIRYLRRSQQDNDTTELNCPPNNK
jgi:four helix bundle protein